MYLSFVVFFYLLSSTNGRTWSSWSSCESTPNCFRRRVLTCDDGEGIQCARDELYEQSVVSFSMNGCDEVCIDDDIWRISSTNKTSTKENCYYQTCRGSMKYHLCQGDCYDSTKIISYNCQGYPNCQLLDYYRCYVEQTCTGVWLPTETFTQCSATCGGGTQTAVAECKNVTTGKTSYNCVGTDYGLIARSEVLKVCNTKACSDHQAKWIKFKTRKGVSHKTHGRSQYDGNAKHGTKVRREKCTFNPCNMWTLWVPITQCNALCGGGIRRFVRNCLCSNVTTQSRNQPCNTQSCTYTWSSWRESTPCNASCGGGRRQLISTCNDEDGNEVALCDNSNGFTRTRSVQCNLDSCPYGKWTPWTSCDSCDGVRIRKRDCFICGPISKDTSSESCLNSSACLASATTTSSLLIDQPYFPVVILTPCLFLIVVIFLAYRWRAKTSSTNKNLNHTMEMSKTNQQEILENAIDDTRQLSDKPVHLYEKIRLQQSSKTNQDIYVNELGDYINVYQESNLKKNDDNPYNIPDEPNSHSMSNTISRGTNFDSQSAPDAVSTKPDDSQYETFGNKK